MKCNIVELRQYALHPGRRDGLIDLFDREFIEAQEVTGMAVLGQFRDLDRPDHFVWLRGFEDMPSRARALTDFYAGPAWKAHAAQANATMIDVDDVLLLRPAAQHTGFLDAMAGRPSPGHSVPPSSALILATIYHRDYPYDEAFLDLFCGDVLPVLRSMGTAPLACLQTEYAENNFPALPVRSGVNAFVWLARFESTEHIELWLQRVRSSQIGRSGNEQHLRLSPTGRSMLR